MDCTDITVDYRNHVAYTPLASAATDLPAQAR